MKRIVIVLPLLAGLAGPMLAFSTSAAPAMSAYDVTEPIAIEPIAIGLPWSTVSAVLEAVTDVRPYSYSELVNGYQAGLVTVEALGSGYEVRIMNADGALDVVIIEGV